MLTAGVRLLTAASKALQQDTALHIRRPVTAAPVPLVECCSKACSTSLASLPVFSSFELDVSLPASLRAPSAADKLACNINNHETLDLYKFDRV